MVRFFPVAAATNCHKPGDFKQQTFVLSQFWRPEFQRQYHEAQIKVGRTTLPEKARGIQPGLFSSCSHWHSLAVAVSLQDSVLGSSALPLPPSCKSL